MSVVVKVLGRVMPLADWPVADRQAWGDALTVADIFDPVPRPALRWRPITRELVRSGYGRWLAWLDDSGLLGRDTLPARRVTRERVAAYKAHLALTDAEYSVAGRVQQLGDALRAIAPRDDWGWILRGSGRLRAMAEPARDKRLRLQPLEDLAALGLDLIHRAETDAHATALMRAKMHRDGLIISLLVRRPIRAGNLGIITLGQHLEHHGSGWTLSFTPGMTKQSRHLEPPWPECLVAPLERHLEVHRPLLLACTRKSLPPTSRLWISAQGTPMTYGAISLQVKARTKAVFGQSLNPHGFRDCAATAIATHAPEQARDIALVLGHAGMATSERHYNQAKMLSANGTLQDVVEAVLRRMTPAKPKRRGAV